MVTRKKFASKSEWLLARKGKIGGSDAAAVLGLNPYKNNVEFWNEMVGITKPRDISNEPYVIYGSRAEEHIRAIFALDHPEYKVEYFGDNMLLNDKYPFAHASLDGELTELETGQRVNTEYFKETTPVLLFLHINEINQHRLKHGCQSTCY